MDVLFELISDLFSLLLKAVVSVSALAWLASIAFAQRNCSIIPHIGAKCTGERLDIWMIPFFFAIWGIPATVMFIFIVRRALR